MVDREIPDGRRIAELLAAELRDRDRPPMDAFDIVDEDWTVDDASSGDEEGPGSRVYTVTADGDPLADVVVQPDRVYLEFVRGLTDAEAAAREAELRARPKATTPPRLLVFVEQGAAVKRATDALVAAATAD